MHTPYFRAFSREVGILSWQHVKLREQKEDQEGSMLPSSYEPSYLLRMKREKALKRLDQIVVAGVQESSPHHIERTLPQGVRTKTCTMSM